MGKARKSEPLIKQEDEQEPMDTEEGDEAEEGEEEEEKSELATDDLRKSLRKLESLATDETPATRREALLSKAMRDDLDPNERDELFALMGGGTDPNSLAARVQKAMDPSENEPLQKSIDVSDFLSEIHTATTRALETVAEAIEKSDSRQHEFNVVLAKSMLDLGNAVQKQAAFMKSVGGRLGMIEKQPIRAPKSKGLAAPIEKSFAGHDPDSALSKSEILQTLEAMMLKSDQEGRGGTANCGEDLLHAIAKYESINAINPALLNEVISFRASSGRARN